MSDIQDRIDRLERSITRLMKQMPFATTQFDRIKIQTEVDYLRTEVSKLSKIVQKTTKSEPFYQEFDGEM